MTTSLPHLPDTIIAADWSVDPRKRWRSTIRRHGDSWSLHAAAPVGSSLLACELASQDGKARQLVGYDFPIGIPADYARLVPTESFDDLLEQLSSNPAMSAFGLPAASILEVSRFRPFFPSGNAWKGYRQQLADAFGFSTVNSLKRKADLATKSATPLFALGTPQQVGRAAYHGWVHELMPNRAKISVWPFEGALGTLVESPGTVVTEIYPGLAAKMLNAKPKRKTDVGMRRAVADKIFAALSANRCEPTTEAKSQIESGYAQQGDDAFDACIAVVSMLVVVMSYSSAHEPPRDVETRTEGWILGLTSSDPHALSAGRSSRLAPGGISSMSSNSGT